MSRLTTIELAKEYLKFSVAHFTIFNASERERLHGHNFTVSAKITAPVDDNGLCFPYNIFKKYLKSLCKQLDEYTIIAKDSPHLSITEQGDYYHVAFNNDQLILLKTDTLLLPVRNTTVEELAHYLVQIMSRAPIVSEHNVQSIQLFVSSGPGQSGSGVWSVES